MCMALVPLCAVAVAVQESEGVVEEPEGDDAIVFGPTKEDMKRDAKAERKENDQKEQGLQNSPPPDKKDGDSLEPGYGIVVLQGLNKVTAHMSKIEAVIGSTVRFGTLEIVARSCWKSAPGDQPENAALLEIYEIKQGAPPGRIFSGWMFSSSPGLSSLENPFYDITVVKCERQEGGKL